MSNRKGRSPGKNKPRVNRLNILSGLHEVMKNHAHLFVSGDITFSKLWDFYKDVLLVAPSLSIAFELPVTVYGVGTYKVQTNTKGKKKLRVKPSETFDTFFSENEDVQYLNDYDYVFKSLSNFDREDKSVLEIKELSLGVEEIIES